MKKIPYTSIFIIFSIALASCKRDINTSKFGAYLYANYKRTIGNEPSFYLLVPDNQCPNCIHFDDKEQDRITVISGLDQSHFANFTHYLYDKENKMSRLPFLDYSNKLVMTKAGKVVAVVIPYDLTWEIDSLEKVF